MRLGSGLSANKGESSANPMDVYPQQISALKQNLTSTPVVQAVMAPRVKRIPTV
jgi:hypothetical protein